MEEVCLLLDLLTAKVLDDVDREIYHKDSVYLYRFIRKRRGPSQ